MVDVPFLSTLAAAGAPALAVAALAVEAIVGYPGPVYRAIGHPVTWIGALIAGLDRTLNRPAWSATTRRLAGVGAVLVLVTVSGGCALVLQTALLGLGSVGWLLLVVVAASLPAQRSLHDHVAAVATALEREGLAGGRRAVSMIVGRNPETLDEAGVARAALESLGENFSDGIVAPLAWIAAGGLVGGTLYKAINTADSMIGHLTERHAAFGWAAARLDDLVNLPASRLSALWLVLAAATLPGASPAGALRAVRRDASRHRSPNAGWPEAALAGALGLQLAGPRVYGTTRVDDAFMGDGRRDATAADIRRGLALYRRACGIQAGVLVSLVVLLIVRG